jgi:cobyrinic acid a,c-diamide synthase
MSVPRVLLIPTHHTGLADGIAAAVSEIAAAQGHEVRYHHIGPLAPMSAWDRWEGAVFVDPALTGTETLLGLYEVAVRHADISLLSTDAGLLDRTAGIDWVPADLIGLLDCPVVVVMDCRGWGTGIKVQTAGIRAHMRPAGLVGAILSGVADEEHYSVLKKTLADDGIRIVGCLFTEQGLGWDSAPPSAWGLPLSTDTLEIVERQVDVGGLLALAGQRGFLATHKRLSDHGAEGPVVLVASGKGFTQWSRDSVEVLRSAGAQVRRLDLLADAIMPAEAAGLVMAGTLWPDTIPDIAMNTILLQDIAAKVRRGLPTLALGGGMLLLLDRLQDTYGRTSELAGVIPAQGEILWDLEGPAYVEVSALRDNVLLEEGERVTGWALSEVELSGIEQPWDPPLALRGTGTTIERRETFGEGALLCSPAMMHLGATRTIASRFVDRCKAYAASGVRPIGGS